MQGIGLEYLAGLRIQTSRHQYLILFLTCSNSHHHGLSSSGSTIVHRGISDVHPCQLGHHTLVLKDIVKRALRDFCLIGSVRRQELRALQQLRNDRGGIVVVDAHTRKARQLLVHEAELLK